MPDRQLLRIFRFLFLLVVLLPVLANECCGEPPAVTDRKLVILNWSDYLDPEVLAEFTRKTGIRVNEVYFETDELRNEMLVTAGGKGFDLILASGISIAAYAGRGWLSPLAEEEIPNLRFVDKKWREAFPAASRFGVPYLWGTLGIAYRADLLSEPVTSWMALFRPTADLKGKVLMYKDSRDMMGMALKALGHSANSTDPAALDAAKTLLLAQKPFVRSYSFYALTEDADLVTGKAAISMMYNGDALTLKEFNPTIAFVVPNEGGNLWCDYFVLSTSSDKHELAVQFLNFIHEPAVMARLARFASFATTNTAAEKLLPADFLTDPVIYPPPTILARSESYVPLPPRVMKRINTIFNTVIR
ncbi:MAG: polyamine ABC transporter substrate-binding protein [Thermodesulfobacteriota bacterium]